MDEIARDEWCFDFRVFADQPVSRESIDKLMCEIVRWAEANDLGIGGGYKALSQEMKKASRAWRFHFGMCQSDEDRPISESIAMKLRTQIEDWCAKNWYSFDGGFREFTAEESEVV
jgi:hypothetical protein